jgi:FkbM family methyltransferase
MMQQAVTPRLDAKGFKSAFEAFVGDASPKEHAGQLEIPGHRSIAWPRKSNREDTVILVLSFLIGQLRPRAFFDIGSATGDFTCIAASHLESPPSVYAFDMRPAALEALRSRAASEGFESLVATHLTGLSDHHEGERDIWFARTRFFEHEPAKRTYQEAWWIRFKFYLKNKQRGLVASRALVTSLDHWVEEHGVVPELLKIDVDGYETKVLKGGAQTFAKRRPPIMLELHKDSMLVEGNRADVVSTLLDIGYDALFLTDHHNAKACSLVPVDDRHPLVARQETDFILFL